MSKTFWSLRWNDPTLLFAAACVLLPVVRGGDPLLLLQYVREPAVLVGLCATLGVVWVGKQPGEVTLEAWEVRAATWYLMNAFAFHYVFDFCVPVLNAVPVLRATYNATIWVVCHLEAMLDTPLCFAVFVAYLRGWAARRPLEIFLAGMQFAGTVVFQGTELHHGLRNTPPAPHNVGGAGGMLEHLSLDPRGDWARFESQFLFFWFAFCVANSIWYVVPLRLAWAAGAGLCGEAGRGGRATKPD